jgi:threonine dehydrogenase-like Zn-dependent dehydrogenase
MAHLKSVEVSDGTSTWTAMGPAGSSVTWQAELVLDRPAECIGWRSVPGTTSVPNRGVVRFARAPGNRGTEVQVELKYEPPAGALGAAFAKLFGEEMGAVVNRALTIRSGQCHAHRYLKPLLHRIELGEIDPSFVITHRLPLSEAAHGFEIFHKKLDGCEKVVLKAA